MHGSEWVSVFNSQVYYRNSSATYPVWCFVEIGVLGGSGRTVTCHAQVAATPTLKSLDSQADAAILRSAFEQLHPGLYRYNTKAEMDEAFVTLSRQLDHDQTLQDAFLAISEFAAKVRCGHTQANLFRIRPP